MRGIYPILVLLESSKDFHRHARTRLLLIDAWDVVAGT